MVDAKNQERITNQRPEKRHLASHAVRGRAIATFRIPDIGVILSLFVNEGSGGFGFIIMSRDVYVAAVSGFVMGFYWRFRRLKRDENK